MKLLRHLLVGRAALVLLASIAIALRAESPSSGATAMNVSAPRGMVQIPAGNYTPILRGKDEPERVSVAAYWLDARPVTNAEFLEFVRANPKWRRSQVAAIFADAGYLGDWSGDLEL